MVLSKLTSAIVLLLACRNTAEKHTYGENHLLMDVWGDMAAEREERSAGDSLKKEEEQDVDKSDSWAEMDEDAELLGGMGGGRGRSSIGGRSSAGEGQPQYWVIVDCNRDRSKLYLFEYAMSTEEDIAHQQMRKLNHELIAEVEGGLHEYVEEPDKAVEPLLKLFAQIKGKFPKRKARDTKVTLFLTGPLRWMKAKVQREMEDTLKTGLLDSHDFVFSEKKFRLEVLPTHKEHSYDTTAANFLLERMNSHLRLTREGADAGRAGTIDDDGQHSWIAIPRSLHGKGPRPMDSSAKLGEAFDVYKYSNYGFDAFRTPVDEFAVKDMKMETLPCYFPGYLNEVWKLKGSGDAAECQKAIMTKVNADKAACRKKLARRKEWAAEQRGHFKPTEMTEADCEPQNMAEATEAERKEEKEACLGQNKEELKQYNRALADDEELKTFIDKISYEATECAPGIHARSRLGLTDRPALVYVGGGYITTAKFAAHILASKGNDKLQKELPSPRPHTITEAADEICKIKWEDINLGTLPEGLNKTDAANMCFKMNYMAVMLIGYHGYKNRNNEGATAFVMFDNVIKNQTIDWPLGAFLHMRQHDQEVDSAQQFERFAEKHRDNPLKIEEFDNRRHGRRGEEL